MKKPAEKKLVDASHLVRRTNLYQEFQAELEEILRHKWIESEKAGKDIGFEQALVDWNRNHRDKWRAVRRHHSTVTTNGCAGGN